MPRQWRTWFESCRRLEQLRSFYEFLERRFLEFRRNAYCLMANQGNLTKIPKQRLRETGWRKAAEMVRVPRREGEGFDHALLVHKAKVLNRKEFEREVGRHLTGKESGPWSRCISVYKSQLAMIEQALETSALMLGSGKSRGYRPEIICADLLAGANIETGDSNTLVLSLDRLFGLLPPPKQQEFLGKVNGTPWRQTGSDVPG